MTSEKTIATLTVAFKKECKTIKLVSLKKKHLKKQNNEKEVGFLTLSLCIPSITGYNKMYVKCICPVVPSIRILHTFATYSKSLFYYPVVPGIRILHTFCYTW